MALYAYTGTETRYYPALGRAFAPGDRAEFEADPPADGRWEAAKAPANKPAPSGEPIADLGTNP